MFSDRGVLGGGGGWNAMYPLKISPRDPKAIGMSFPGP